MLRYLQKALGAHLCTPESTPHCFHMIQRACNGLIYVAGQSSAVGNKGLRRMLPAFSILLVVFLYYENSALRIQRLKSEP